jgi:hypothetical protein
MMKIKEKQKNEKDELGSMVIKIIENSELSEEQKNEKITEILIDAVHYAGRVNRSFRDRTSSRLSKDGQLLFRIANIAEYLPEKEKARILKEVVNAYMNVVTAYKWKHSYQWVADAVYIATKIPGDERIEILEGLGKEFLKRNWTWSASLVAKALDAIGEKEKAKELQRKVDLLKAALKLNKNKEYQPHPVDVRVDWDKMPDPLKVYLREMELSKKPFYIRYSKSL